MCLAQQPRFGMMDLFLACLAPSSPAPAWLIADTSVCYRYREGQLIVSPAHTSMFRPVFGDGDVEGPHLPMFSDSLRRMRIRIKDRSDGSRVRTNI
jgi:hypothetical protein